MCMRNETLAKVLDERDELKNQIDILTAKVKEIEENLKVDMDKRIENAKAKAEEKGEEIEPTLGETYEFDFDGKHRKINYHYYEENRFNTDAFKKENPEMYKHYCGKIERARLTVK